MDDALRRMIGKPVVLDTGTPIIFIGTLDEIGEHVFVLTAADMHDCRDGHANKEHYLAEIHQDGVTVNRRQIVVMRSAIISVSLLEDIVTS